MFDERPTKQTRIKKKKIYILSLYNIVDLRFEFKDKNMITSVMQYWIFF